MNQPIRVLVVDDSALMRRLIASLLEQDAAIRVVGAARNGREAIELVEQMRPDVVTMDVRMPVLDGLAATEHLMAYCPTPILVVTASPAEHDVGLTFKMLAAGALEVFEKPSAANPVEIERAGRALIRRVKVLARVKVVTHLRGRRRSSSVGGSSQVTALSGQNDWASERKDKATKELRHSAGPFAPAAGDFPLVVIGASTGGPRVVAQLLAGLPSDFPAAVVVVQHIAAGFSAGLAEWLAHSSKLPIGLAREEQPIRQGEILVAPDQHDLLITADARVHLSGRPLLLQRPSIDISMQAAAEVFGARAIGVLLTGMGRDGAQGMLAIRRAGGHTIAQDEATSTIFGMPRAAILLGAAHEVLPPAQIAKRLVELLAESQVSSSMQRTRGEP